MAVHRIKRSFTAGEISPLLMMRTDHARYKSGCKTLRNMYCLSQGPVTRRPGTKYIADLTDALDAFDETPTYCLVPFVYSVELSYVLIFMTGEISSVLTTRVYVATNDSEEDGTFVSGLVADPAGDAAGYVETTITIVAGQFKYAQVGNTLFIAQADTYPCKLVIDNDLEWAFATLNGEFTNEPDEWDTNDYPSVVSLYEQRAVWGASPSYPQTLWLTKAGDLYDFSSGAGEVLALDDALTFTLASGQQNSIQWLASTRQLLIGTLGSEWTLSGAGYDPLSYASVVANRHTNAGGEGLPPLMVGATTLFVERLGRRVYQYAYDYNVDGYKTTDLTILAPHFTDVYAITDWAFQSVPHAIIWCVREDGALLGLTYQAEHQVVGWHLHTTDGEFKNAASIPNPYSRETDVWFLVERVIDEATVLYLEKLGPTFVSGDTEDAFFVDSGLSYSGEAATTFEELGHLEGKEVQILADGAVHPPKTVSSGAVTLDYSASVVHIGLGFNSDVEPVLEDLTLSDGTSLGRRQRLASVNIYFHESVGFKYGRNVDNLSEIISFRAPADPVDAGVPLFTGFKEVTFPSGYDNVSNVYIRQSQPLPLTVVGITDEIEVGER